MHDSGLVSWTVRPLVFAFGRSAWLFPIAGGVWLFQRLRGVRAAGPAVAVYLALALMASDQGVLGARIHAGLVLLVGDLLPYTLGAGALLFWWLTSDRRSIAGARPSLLADLIAALRMPELPRRRAAPPPPIDEPVVDEVLEPAAAPHAMPGVDLLAPPRVATSRAMPDPEAVRAALAEYGTASQVEDVYRGPSCFLYVCSLGPRQSLANVAKALDNLRVRMKGANVRLVPSIPGRAAFGVEVDVPQAQRRMIALREVVEAMDGRDDAAALPVAIGVDAMGEPVFADLARMPHLLIAGTTGGGKSVCMSALLSTLLMRRRPEQVRFAMIDPKRVELAPYTGIPHLWRPIVNEDVDAARLLGELCGEMERRYAMLEAAGVRDLGELLERDGAAPPRLVCVVDELADLFMADATSPGGMTCQDAVRRIAQKGRAAGLHLILATQRPSVDVIDGVIKANVPGRISLAVSSLVDSKVVFGVDGVGAERLMKDGDMLFLDPSTSREARRVQGAYVSPAELRSLVAFWRDVDATEEAAPPPVAHPAREATPFERAARHAVDQGAVSVAGLKALLGVGHAAASRVMAELEAAGVVGAAEGARPRRALLDDAALSSLLEDQACPSG